MEPKHQVHNLIILDESGSMESIKSSIISGFNELVQSIKGIQEQFPEQEHFISMVSFNSSGNKMMHFNDPVSKLNFIDASNYKPNACTPLYDAMGFSLSKLKQYLENKMEYNVLVTILTDGEENASKEFTGIAIKNLIDELSLGNWTFTYVGADHDVEKMAKSLSIKNTMTFDKNKGDIQRMFKEDRSGRVAYSRKIGEGLDFKEDFYEKKGENKTTEKDQPVTKITPKKKGFLDSLHGKN